MLVIPINLTLQNQKLKSINLQRKFKQSLGQQTPKTVTQNAKKIHTSSLKLVKFLYQKTAPLSSRSLSMLKRRSHGVENLRFLGFVEDFVQGNANLGKK